MITEHDLREAIAECEGSRHPTASTCLKLAAFYTILNQMKGKTDIPVNGYSFDAPPEPEIQYSDSDFSAVVQEKGMPKVFPILDELMDVLFVVNQPLYDNAMRKLRGS